LNACELAEARSRGYGLLARLLVEGPTPELLARLEGTPLAEALPDSPDSPDSPDTDALAAAHHALFQLEVFPYAGLFLEDGGLLGGDIAAAFQADCDAVGFGARPDVASADHLGAVAGLLAFLAGAEADALADGEAAAAKTARDHLRAALDRWLLSWILPLGAAVGAVGDPLWSAVIEMLASLAIDHRVALGGAAESRALPPPPEELLARKETGLKRIAEVLLTPAYSGVYLSRQDIAALARGRDTPRGFGGRLQMLTNLLRNASEYNDLPGLLATLDEVLAARALPPAGLPEAHAAPWQGRVAWTRALVAQISEAAA